MIKITLIKYLVLGIIQGFTEPLPISSSGHLKIFKSMFNSDILNDLNFEIIVNFGSLIAIIILYRKEIINIIKDFFLYIKTKNKIYKTNFNYVFKIVIATIPVCIIGLLLKDFIEEYFNGKIIGLMFIITALLLYKIKDKNGNKTKKDITYLDALKIGLFQIIALSPGVSRSASTLVGGLQQDLNKDTAINFSFMLYIPVSIASFILGISDVVKSPNISNLFIPYFISMIIAGIVTYFSAKLFINIVKKRKLIYFYTYCFILGLLIFFTF